jgi:hypothetical protein
MYQPSVHVFRENRTYPKRECDRCKREKHSNVIILKIMRLSTQSSKYASWRRYAEMEMKIYAEPKCAWSLNTRIFQPGESSHVRSTVSLCVITVIPVFLVRNAYDNFLSSEPVSVSPKTMTAISTREKNPCVTRSIRS